ncbi:MAG: hypothetical protein BMS9Abin26_2048 [Gammaproteobacteria bacterium]|nr:MAG: hypothetical protein BMS9Abin26_2048 [Gammaproteobacteria bacterium]
MRLRIYTIFIFLLFMLGGPSANAEEWNYLQKSKINWREYNEQAFLEASKKNKPLYVFIFADWCPWCKKFETESLETKLIRSLLSEKFIPVAINQEKQPDLSKQLGARLVPASVLLTPKNRRIVRFYGFLTAQELSDILNKSFIRWSKGEVPEAEVPRDEFGDESTCCPLPKSN